MPRVDAVYRHPRFQEELARIDALERERTWCRHGLAHLLDVARIAWIGALEECGPQRVGDVSETPGKELVYAAALLHDIGRAEQYATGVPHDVAGARIARKILDTLGEDASFSAGEHEAILAAVQGHRGMGPDDAGPDEGASAMAADLARLIARADKASRACFACDARATCNWPDAKKNLTFVA